MIYPLLPVFLSTVLGANASFIGAIEGAAESTASLLKLASGWWSDKVRKRKPFVVWGYGIATAVRPLVALAQSAGVVLGIRVADRVGKGIRSSARDALLADSVEPALRGRAFGFHASADNAGAVVGPLIAFALLRYMNLSLRNVFWLAAIPGVFAFIVLVTAVRDIEAPVAKEDAKKPFCPPRSSTRGSGFISSLCSCSRLATQPMLFCCCDRTSSVLLLRLRRFYGRCSTS